MICWIKKLRALICMLLTVLMPVLVKAEVPQWQILPNESHLSFTAIQNDAPVSGKFKTFTGEICFDPEQLNASHVRIVVDIASVATPYSDLTTTLLTPDWFNVKIFPQAIFTANSFTKISEKQYQAKGSLTIRDKTLPVTLTFSFTEYSKTKALVKGSTTLKRTLFGIGQGEWTSTDEVKDDVQVNFVIATMRLGASLYNR